MTIKAGSRAAVLLGLIALGGCVAYDPYGYYPPAAPGYAYQPPPDPAYYAPPPQPVYYPPPPPAAYYPAPAYYPAYPAVGGVSLSFGTTFGGRGGGHRGRYR